MPQLSAREIVRLLKKQGFVEHRQSGGHLTLWHEQRMVSLTMPIRKGRDIGRGLAARILKSAGFSIDDFLRLR